MIFKLHYFSFNAGLSGVLMLITVFIRRYSDASSTELGVLLMILPFLATVTRPFFCSLADRHRRHRLYLILALVCALIGFGSYTVLPFVPDSIAKQGRCSWYILAACTALGYLAFGIVGSLADTLAANMSQRTGESLALTRLWGTVGWGVAGAMVGAVAPLVELPEMVLGLLVFVGAASVEIVALVLWRERQDFEPVAGLAAANRWGDICEHNNNNNHKLATLTEKPRAASNAYCNDIMLSLGQLRSGELSISRTKSNSLTITTKVKLDVEHESGDRLDRTISELVARTRANEASDAARIAQRLYEVQRRKVSELQLTIVKMLAMEHKSLVKYTILFVVLGTLHNILYSYFFLHVERLAAEGRAHFSQLVSMCLVAQSVGESVCFVAAPWLVDRLGRDVTISLSAAIYAARYLANGLAMELVSPYAGVLSEFAHGLNRGLLHCLIADTALHYGLLVDTVVPELRRRRLIDKDTDLDLLRWSSRTSMRRIMGAAFDGLGAGLGSLVAGVGLERHSCSWLWLSTGGAAALVLIVHGVYELVNRTVRRYVRKLRDRRWDENLSVSHYYLNGMWN